jgi:transposase
MKQGLKPTAIAKKAGVPLTTVKRWSKRFRKAELEGIAAHLAVIDKPRSGAPPKITDAMGKAIIKFTEGKPDRPASAIQVFVQRRFGVVLSVRHIQRFLIQSGLKPYHRRKQLKLRQAHKSKRVAFARAHLTDNWSRTLFTDETEFLLHPTRGNPTTDIVWARRQEDVPAVEVDQYSPKLRVWGGISAQGKTRLVFYTGELDATAYQKILRRASPDFTSIFGTHPWSFVHDGASPHKAASTNTWLSAHVPHHIPSGPGGAWPAKSPELNPIEQVWGIMKESLQKKRPQSLEALQARVKKIWEEFDINIVARQAAAMPKRLRTIIASRGEWTKN